MIYARTPSPVGPLVLVGSDEALERVEFDSAPDPTWRRDDDAFGAAREQLAAYFAGERERFDLALAPRGTPFQLRVWRALREIPFGRTATYAEIARAIGKPTASRAVGAANRVNPFAIVVPCHRVIGASGDLTGYAGGLPRKRWLLDHEFHCRRVLANQQGSPS